MAGKNPLPPNKFRLPHGPTEIMKSFLNGLDLFRYSKTSKANNELSDKDTVKIMLHLVLNPQEINVQKLREMIKIEKSKLDSKLDCLVLRRAEGQEEYETEYKIETKPDGTKKEHKLEKKQKMVKRSWKNISPLEAAAWSGDNFLLQELLECVPKHLYKEAIEQLKRVKNEKLEHGEYLAPFKALIQSYNEYIKEFKEQEEKPPINTKVLENMMLEKVGLSQNNLSTYGLQEFCNIESSIEFPIPQFDAEPPRDFTLYTGDNIDLGLLGSTYSLYNGSGYTFPIAAKGRLIDWQYDAIVINSLYEARTQGLNKIIESLESSLKLENESSHSNASNNNASENNENNNRPGKS